MKFIQGLLALAVLAGIAAPAWSVPLLDSDPEVTLVLLVKRTQRKLFIFGKAAGQGFTGSTDILPSSRVADGIFTPKSVNAFYYSHIDLLPVYNAIEFNGMESIQSSKDFASQQAAGVASDRKIIVSIEAGNALLDLVKRHGLSQTRIIIQE